MSDHLDASGLKSPNMDARVDITDIFAFQNPADPTRSVLVMNANPVAPTLADSFSPEAIYELILDTDGDAVRDVGDRVIFFLRENGGWSATVRRATGEDARTAEISSELLFRDVPLSFDADAGIVEGGNHEFFVGIRSDPFFFDLEGFQHDFAFTGEDKNAFNRADPDQDRDFFLETSAAVLEKSGRSSDEARTVAETLLPDGLAYDHRTAAAFPNGRSVADDVIDAMLELSGLAAKTVTLAYHLYALPSTPHRLRVGLDWVLGAVLPCPLAQLGLVREEDARLAVAERTGIYAAPRRPVEESTARGRMKGTRR